MEKKKNKTLNSNLVIKNEKKRNEIQQKQYDIYTVYDGIYGKFLFKDFKKLLQYGLIPYVLSNDKFDESDLKKIVERLANECSITKIGAALLYSNIGYITDALKKTIQDLKIKKDDIENKKGIVDDIIKAMSNNHYVFSYMKTKWVKDLKTRQWQSRSESFNNMVGNGANPMIDYYIVQPIIAEIDTIVREVRGVYEVDDENFMPEIIRRLFAEGSTCKATYDSLREYLYFSKYLNKKETETNKQTAGFLEDKIDSNVETVSKMFEILHQTLNNELSEDVATKIRKGFTLINPARFIWTVAGITKEAICHSLYDNQVRERNNNPNYVSDMNSEQKEDVVKRIENMDIANLYTWSKREDKIGQNIGNELQHEKGLNRQYDINPFFRNYKVVSSNKKAGFFTVKHRVGGDNKDYIKVLKSAMIAKYNLYSRTRLSTLVKEELEKKYKEINDKDSKISFKHNVEMGNFVLSEDVVEDVCKKVVDRYNFERWGKGVMGITIPKEAVKNIFFTKRGKFYARTNKFAVADKNSSDIDPAISQFMKTIKEELFIFKNQVATMQQAKNKLYNIAGKDNEDIKEGLEEVKYTVNKKMHDYLIGGQQSNIGLSSTLTYALDNKLISDVAGIVSGVAFWNNIASTIFGASAKQWVEGSDGTPKYVERVEEVDSNGVTSVKFIDTTNKFIGGKLGKLQMLSDKYNPFRKVYKEALKTIEEKSKSVAEEILGKTTVNKINSEFVKVRTKVIRTLRMDKGHEGEEVGDTKKEVEEGLTATLVDTSMFQKLKVMDKDGNLVDADGKQLYQLFYPNGEKVSGGIGIKGDDGVIEVYFIKDNNSQKYVDDYNNFWSGTTTTTEIKGGVTVKNDNYTEGMINNNNDNTSGDDNNNNNGAGQSLPSGVITSSPQNNNNSDNNGSTYQEPEFIKVPGKEEVSYEDFEKKDSSKDTIDITNSSTFDFFTDTVINTVSTGARLFMDAVSALEISTLTRVGLGTTFGLANTFSDDSVKFQEDISEPTKKIKMYTRRFQRLCGSMDQVKLVKKLQDNVGELSNKKIPDDKKINFVYEMINSINAYKSIAADKLASLMEGYIYHYLKHRENAEIYSSRYKGTGFGANIKRAGKWGAGLFGGRGLTGEDAMKKFREDWYYEIKELMLDFKVLKALLSPTRLFKKMKFEDKAIKKRVRKNYSIAFHTLFATPRGIENFGAENPFDTIIDLALRKTVNIIDNKYDEDFKSKAKLTLETFQDRMTFDRQKNKYGEPRKDKDGNEVLIGEGIIDREKIKKGINFYTVKDEGYFVLKIHNKNNARSAKETVSFDPEEKLRDSYKEKKEDKIKVKAGNKKYTILSQKRIDDLLDNYEDKKKIFGDLEKKIIEGGLCHNSIYFNKILNKMNEKFDTIIESGKLYRKSNEKNIEDNDKDSTISKKTTINSSEDDEEYEKLSFTESNSNNSKSSSKDEGEGKSTSSKNESSKELSENDKDSTISKKTSGEDDEEYEKLSFTESNSNNSKSSKKSFGELVYWEK